MTYFPRGCRVEDFTDFSGGTSRIFLDDPENFLTFYFRIRSHASITSNIGGSYLMLWWMRCRFCTSSASIIGDGLIIFADKIFLSDFRSWENLLTLIFFTFLLFWCCSFVPCFDGIFFSACNTPACFAGITDDLYASPVSGVRKMCAVTTAEWAVTDFRFW